MVSGSGEMRIEPIVSNSINTIEIEHDVRVIYACESGSRAWGFDSHDSDYDIRFIYLNQPEWYLSIDIDHKPDVIELPIKNELDINGWDLRKALQLFQKSNPPLLEWLGSPIVYFEKYAVIRRMRELSSTCYSPIACQYHYFKMAKGNYREYLTGDRVWLKKYLYVLRPVLAVIWLERQLGVVPTEFQKLVDSVVEDANLKIAINELLDLKRSGSEMDYAPKIPEISQFLESELARMERDEFERRIGDCPMDTLNIVFRTALDEVWT
jgi:predicted nucleotidyltransferase